MNSWPDTLEHLRTLVEERTEEAFNLEFKRELPKSGQNEVIAKDLTALANTQGGLVLYGVDEDDEGRAKDLVPITLAGVPERLAQVARVVDGPLVVETWTIPESIPGGLGFVIARVPMSARAPHFVQGTAWGRSSRNLYRLSRHEIGHLFARSSGFAEEFGLRIGRPGRLAVRGVKEVLRGQEGLTLLFGNDGESQILKADWDFTTANGESPSIKVADDPFPFPTLEPGAEVRVRVFHVPNDVRGLRIETRWIDVSGQQQQAIWPLN